MRKQEVKVMVFDKVKEIVADQLDADVNSIEMSSDIQGDLEADSLDIIDMIEKLEDEFDIEIPDAEVQNMKTVGDIVTYIEDHQE
jgi:acyl carrier protein